MIQKQHLIFYQDIRIHLLILKHQLTVSEKPGCIILGSFYLWRQLTRLFCQKKLNVNSRINSKLIWLKRRRLTSYFWRHTSRQKFESTSQIWKKIFKSWISEAWSRDFWTDSAKNQKQNVEFLEKFQRRKWGSESVRWNSLNLLFRKRNFVKMDCSINMFVTSKIELF